MKLGIKFGSELERYGRGRVEVFFGGKGWWEVAWMRLKADRRL